MVVGEARVFDFGGELDTKITVVPRFVGIAGDMFFAGGETKDKTEAVGVFGEPGAGGRAVKGVKIGADGDNVHREAGLMLRKTRTS